MSTVQEILNAASSLPSADRLQIIHLLAGTISPDEWPAPTDVWVAEANRRTDAIDQGQMTSTSWTDARAAARREAGLGD